MFKTFTSHYSSKRLILRKLQSYKRSYFVRFCCGIISKKPVPSINRLQAFQFWLPLAKLAVMQNLNNS